MLQRSGEERRIGERRQEDRRSEDRDMSVKKFGIEWRYDTLVGFISLIIVCMLCTYAINKRLAVNAEIILQSSDSLRESLRDSAKSQEGIIKQVTAIEVEQRVLEDKLADREKSLESLSHLIRKKAENK